MIVVKFGGTSVADGEAIRRAAEIVRSKRDRQPIVLVSALAGTTNALLALAEQAAAGHLVAAVSSIESLRDRHLTVATSLLDKGPPAVDIAGELGAHFDELAQLAEALSILGDCTPRSLDAIGAKGEQCSSLLAAAAFRACGIDSEHVDARQIVITDDNFTRAEPDADAIAERVRSQVLPLVHAGRVPVLGGYIGSTRRGITTTLGRGGSDYSASLIGAAGGAEAIEIWTDVDGMLTADPRVVSGARLIEQIRFDEASELASFGAKVLHPSTIAPAVKLGIPVFVFNARNPHGVGTRITSEAPRRPVSAIAGKSGVVLIEVLTPRMLLTHGFLRGFFEIFERHRASVDVVATSEVSISVTVDDPTALEGLVVDLRSLGDVRLERNRGVIAVVGAGLAEARGAIATALDALGDVRIHLLSLSASGINLTIVVDGDAVAPGLRRLHDRFFGNGSS
ncbi:MAG: lysine-sensitive aspartokinase 3 [Gemmatimonadaceae bacterium]